MDMHANHWLVALNQPVHCDYLFPLDSLAQTNKSMGSTNIHVDTCMWSKLMNTVVTDRPGLSLKL